MTTVNIAITTGVGADTYIASGAPTANIGIRDEIQLSTGASNRRPLLRFDLYSIDPSKIIQSALLKLTPKANYNSATYNLFQVSDDNGNWIEGTKNGTLAGAGEPCWNAKQADGSGGVTEAWAGSAGLSTAGIDYINTVLATLTSALTANTQLEIPFNAAGLAILQSWFGDANNNGFLFLTNTSTQTLFHSGEATTESYRPVLTVTYTEAGGLLKVNMNAQMQSLNGGMRG